jgi:DNA sulfur modification protein DndC
MIEYVFIKIYQLNSLDQDTLEVWKNVISLVKEEYLSVAQNYPWIVGFSGGKDSTLMVHAIFEALEEIPPIRRNRKIHIVSNDTLVESPLVIHHLNKSTKLINQAAENLGLPIVVIRTYPEIDKTFWSLLIGKGYPSPNTQMRWCTDRLKIQPTTTYIKENISIYGSAIVLLGVRKAESQTRLQSIEKHQNIQGSNLTPHSSLSNAYIFRPIVDLETSQVWEVLGSVPAPWGGTHSELIQLYRDADGGECPVVMSKDDAPGCGTNNSRFGCWTCTVVKKDKSLQGFIDSGKEIYKPLADFRNWLLEIRNDPNYRSTLRRNGRLTFDLNGKHIPGPFTIQARSEILNKLLDVQKEVGTQLISNNEIDLIHKIWSYELANEEKISNA